MDDVKGELDATKRMQRLMLADKELLALEAQLLRKKYEELLRVGFSNAEAVQIVARQGA